MTFLLGDVPGVSVVAEGPCEAYVLKHSDLVGMLTQVCSRRGLAPKGCSYEGVGLWDEAAPPWAVREYVAPGMWPLGNTLRTHRGTFRRHSLRRYPSHLRTWCMPPLHRLLTHATTPLAGWADGGPLP